MTVLLDHAADWHAARRLGIGGSDAKRIMDGDWHALWLEKTGRAEAEDLSNVLQVQLGSFTESFNRAWFERHTGMPVSTEDCEGLTHLTRDYIRANLDGRTANGIFEAKHVSAFAKDNDILARYYPQLQHCLAVTGETTAYLSVIFGNHRWAWFEVVADPDYQDQLLAAEEAFWGHVERDEPPEDQAASKVEIAFDDMRVVDMAGSNAWAVAAGMWMENRDAAKAFKVAEKDLKELVEADVRRAYGAGVEVKRAKNGNLSIREMR